VPVTADITTLDVLARVALAAALGAVLGFERETDGHEAGLRTHVLLALGAALFGLISVGAFDAFASARADSNFQVDVTRVASYVAAGVGFLGAGAIIKTSGGARGLTTAASLWATAAIGLAAGVGFWAGAALTAATALVVLVGLRPVSRLAARIAAPSERLLVRLAPGAEAERAIEEVRRALGGRAGAVRVRRLSGDGVEIAVDVDGHPRVARRLATEIAREPEVVDVRLERA
jgi:putative Mg2+ transporter-C (MgtC) family protein